MKVLSIGNSFSTDAQRWLHDIALSDGYALDCVNLYIGGCSLERHYRNMVSGDAVYRYEINGNTGNAALVSLKDALQKETWDVVTLQQNSRFAGIPESYEPYLSALIGFVKRTAPHAELRFHQTWAFEVGAATGDFEAYHYDTDEMADKIIAASEYHAARTGLPVIPTGRVIAHFRRNVPQFRTETGGMRLTRDERHLSLTLGRCLAGLVFYAFLTGRDIRNISFVPTAEGGETDIALLSVIRENLDAFLKTESGAFGAS